MKFRQIKIWHIIKLWLILLWTFFVSLSNAIRKRLALKIIIYTGFIFFIALCILQELKNNYDNFEWKPIKKYPSSKKNFHQSISSRMRSVSVCLNMYSTQEISLINFKLNCLRIYIRNHLVYIVSVYEIDHLKNCWKKNLNDFSCFFFISLNKKLT